MKELTDKQKAILKCLETARSENRGMPTVRELAQTIGVSSTATVHQHLNALVTKGYIKRSSYKHRSIELSQAEPQAEPDFVNVPLSGTIAAGPPLLAQESYDDFVPLPKHLVGNGDVFGLRVRGESMIEAGIFDGDMVVVRRQPSAENGEIVAAMIGDEATVKFLFRESGRIRLQPANQAMEPIFCDSPVILGKVVLVIRKL